MKKIKFYNGVEMPQLGFGTYLATEEAGYEAVKHALEIGYRHLDTAQMYGNEKMIGDAIKASGIDREEIFITSKQFNHSTLAEMQKGFEQSLIDLQTDYIDLFLIHWPSHRNETNSHTWMFFESLYEQGKVRAIGVSNFKIHHLDALLETAVIPPMINQVELHPGLSQVPLQKYLEAKSIQLQSYGPFMRGGIFEGRYQETLAEVAKKHQASIPQVVVAWGLARGIVMNPKSVTKERILENFQAQFLELDFEDMEKINGLNRGKRVYTDPDNSAWGY